MNAHLVIRHCQQMVFLSRISLLLRSERNIARRQKLTQRIFGSAQNHILDEIIADYMRIVAANGSYRADWFLRFMGLKNYPQYRAGGRLQNYVTAPAMSAGAFKALQSIVKQAAHNLERLDKTCGKHADKPELLWH